MVCYGAALGFNPMPPLGPWLLYQHVGLKEAMMVLMRSMEKGRGGGRVQYGTARQSWACLTVLWQLSSSVAGADITLSSGSIRGPMLQPCVPVKGGGTNVSEQVSMHACDVMSQDSAYTLELLHALLEMYEQE